MQDSDYKRKIIEYLKKNLLKGYTPDSLKWALVNQGYSKVLVERALEQAQKEFAEKAPVLKEKPKITHEIIDENNKPVTIKKPWWKRILGL